MAVPTAPAYPGQHSSGRERDTFRSCGKRIAQKTEETGGQVEQSLLILWLWSTQNPLTQPQHCAWKGVGGPGKVLQEL